MILELITIGFMVGQYVYHRMHEPLKPPPEKFKAPKLADGARITMFWGQCRINKPLVIWYGNVTNDQRIGYPDGVLFYTLSITFVLGIPFYDGIVKLCGIYIDDHPIPFVLFLSTVPNVGGATYLFDNSVGIPEADDRFTSFVDSEFGDGNSSQTMVGSMLEGSMVADGVDAALIPGMRGYCTFHVDSMGRSTSTMPTLSFDVSCYPSVSLDHTSIGAEANPADVLYDILKSPFGKLNMDNTRVDYETFRAAAEQLRIEAHGYSRAIEETTTANEVIADILRQIDAVMYEDPINSQVKLRLIRNDYVIGDTLLITPNTCKKLTTPAAGGWTGRANKVRVIFTDRNANYEDGSATAQNQANAFGQDGDVEEVVLHFPGVCTQELANVIAARELSALSRPIFKCIAIVDRTFLRVVPGDVVRLTWPKWHISGMLMRVAGVTRGTLENGDIELQLIQDFFYTYRGVFHDDATHPPITSFPTDALIDP